MTRRILLILSLILVAIIVVLSVVPVGLRPNTRLSTLHEHFVGYAAAACWFALILKTAWARTVSFGLLCALAGGLELAQAVIPTRVGAMVDFVYSAIGVAMGTIVGTVFAVVGRKAFSRQVPGRGLANTEI